jgi:hypothetical protein
MRLVNGLFRGFEPIVVVVPSPAVDEMTDLRADQCDQGCGCGCHSNNVVLNTPVWTRISQCEE